MGAMSAPGMAQMCREVDDFLREVNEWYDGIERRRLGVTLREEPGRYDKQEEDSTPTMTTRIMTPRTPMEHRGLDNTMAALQLPPAQPVTACSESLC